MREETRYITRDGREFTDREAALQHEARSEISEALGESRLLGRDGDTEAVVEWILERYRLEPIEGGDPSLWSDSSLVMAALATQEGDWRLRRDSQFGDLAVGTWNYEVETDNNGKPVLNESQRAHLIKIVRTGG